MSNKIIGTVYIKKCTEISESGDKQYKQRELIIECLKLHPITLETLSLSYPIFTFKGNECDKLDYFQKGDRVEVTYALHGIKYLDKSTNEYKYFNKIYAQNIEVYTPLNSNSFTDDKMCEPF